jgi:tRNA A37 threonylcarbamoyladenosine dehydratase
MKNEPIHEIRFLKHLATKLSQEITEYNKHLTNDELDGLFSDVDNLIDKIDAIEQKAIALQKTHGHPKQH